MNNDTNRSDARILDLVILSGAKDLRLIRFVVNRRLFAPLRVTMAVGVA
jgi:hypothetical protein